jgi:PhnB protein
MRKDFKPTGYNSVSPYLVVNEAQKLIDLLQKIFDAKELRKYKTAEGRVLHAEMKIDDSVLMLADATETYPQSASLVHVYLPDADAIYKKAIKAGCQPVQQPEEREGDPDRRGGFRDFAGNFWSVSTQVMKEK